ncbi:MAG: energy transducer TonB [endosymbiont of Galathealinum brachiosum]|uniref:Energy transducer TonB n=1 Tax=endosymbiont of Galathealinum brachiosum TaxID=2200906 RepID=A0A370DFY7_9GAMM|nr:MAG: energy transducer TonB [endosymbiont of Galathealinum brachiosum]
MTAIYYDQLALSWHPESRSDSRFKLIVVVTIVISLLFAVTMSIIDVPEPDREAKAVVPERIANFILEKKEKPKPKVVKPKPKPKPKPIVKPKVKKLPKKKVDKKPLTKIQKKARDKAADSGLLALGNELADLMDTSDVSAMVGGKVKSSSSSATKATAVNKALLTADTSKGSGGVKSSKYATRIGSTKLSSQEITQVKQSLLSSGSLDKSKNASRKRKSRTGGVRAEEEITIVFDQNKSKLYSIYNRARRKNPSLKGKIVLAITIAPAGNVTKVKIISSELKDAKLEKRLLSRIKLFKFGAKKVEQVTVTYPIEFLPS